MDWLSQWDPAQLQGLTPLGSLLNLLITFVLGKLLALHYKRYAHSLGNKKQYARLFVFLSITTMMVISVVKSSLALSLGLVGALSIIRFRTPVKEPEDLAYIFLAIALGIGIGADQRAVTLVIFLGLLVILTLQSGSRHASSRQLFLNIQLPIEPTVPVSDTLSKVLSLANEHFGSADLRRMDHLDQSLNLILVLAPEHKRQFADGFSAIIQAFPQAQSSIVEGQTFD